MDMVVHCGRSTVGSYVHRLVLTDIASGWTEAIAMVVREQTLVTESVSDIRTKLPFTVRGLDVDNDSAFINDTLISYCQDNKIELTRCRAYKKNDQAWIEQKNARGDPANGGLWKAGGGQTAAVLNKLFASARLFVNFFQPSFKLISKTHEGAKIIKQYHPPATPCERLLERKDVSDECKEQSSGGTGPGAIAAGNSRSTASARATGSRCRPRRNGSLHPGAERFRRQSCDGVARW